MKLSFKDVTPEILKVIQKVKDRLKDVEITQESDKIFWFKGSVSNILSTSYILLRSHEFIQQVCQWKYIDANFPEYELIVMLNIRSLALYKKTELWFAIALFILHICMKIIIRSYRFNLIYKTMILFKLLDSNSNDQKSEHNRLIPTKFKRS